VGEQAMPEAAHSSAEGAEGEAGEQQSVRPPTATEGTSLPCPVHSGYALLSLKLIFMDFDCQP